MLSNIVVCPFDAEYVRVMLGMIPLQFVVFLVFVSLYLLASYKQILVKTPAEKFFRFKFDSLKNTVAIPIAAGITLSLGFLLLRAILAPTEPAPAALPLSVLLLSSVVTAPILESIADQGLVFLIALSAFNALQNKRNSNSSIFQPTLKVLVAALLIQAAVFGINHVNALTPFYLFKMMYTGFDGLVLGYICWSNNRNLLPVVLSHMAYNITAILFQPFIFC